MQVTEEDGGRLNAFAKEPRMVVMEEGEGRGSNLPLLIGGVLLVLALVAVAAGIS
ncbi:MAG: photosystem II assembly protein Psb34 [Cyanobium sp.]